MNTKSAARGKKILDPKVQVLTIDTNDVPPQLKGIYDNAIQRETVSGEFDFDLTLRVSDLIEVSPDGKHVRPCLHTFSLENASTNNPKLFSLLEDQTDVFFTKSIIRAWSHDSPFFLEISSPEHIRSAQLLEVVHGEEANPEIKKQAADLFPVLVCPPIKLTSKHPTNDIEADLFGDAAENDQVEMVSTFDSRIVFGGNSAVSKFVNTFSGVTQQSITEGTATRGTYVVTPMTSLLGMICRMRGNIHPLTLSNPNFDPSNSYFLKMDSGVAYACMDIIKKQVNAVNELSRARLSDVKFSTKISRIGTVWQCDRDDDGEIFLRDRNDQDGHARSIYLNETISLKLKLFVKVVIPQNSESPVYAMDPLGQNIFFYRPWAPDSLDVNGKPKAILNSRGKQVYDITPSGKKVPRYSEPYTHIDAIHKPLDVQPQEATQFKRSASDLEASSPSSSMSDAFSSISNSMSSRPTSSSSHSLSDD